MAGMGLCDGLQALEQPGCYHGLGLEGWLFALHAALRWMAPLHLAVVGKEK